MKTDKRILVLTIILVLAIAVVLGVRMISFKQTYDKNQEKITELQEKLLEENNRTLELEDLKETIKTDDFIESEARDKFNLYFKDEVIFKPNNQR